jgi:hypothetical protein
MSYLMQGQYPLRESITALVVTEKDKPVCVYGVRGPVGLSWGLWEVPEADNDEAFEDGPQTA